MIVENEENAVDKNNFWKEKFFEEFAYGKYFKEFLLIICSAEQLKNSSCGWIKNRIRHILSEWVNESKFDVVVEVKLKNMLEEYQILSDFERTGKCANENEGWVNMNNNML